MDYNYFMPTRIISGRDCVKKNSRLFRRLGSRCLVVTSGSAAKLSGALADLEDALKLEGIKYSIHSSVEQNPLIEDAYKAGNKAREEGATFIVGVGGGSPLDACKAVALFASNPMDNPEDAYTNKPAKKLLPIIAIGTTAGTGSEVTQYSVMTDKAGRKRSIANYGFFPTYTFGDAKYTMTLPLHFTISTGLDALSHAVEGYFSINANDLSDMFAKEAIATLYTSLLQLKDIRDNRGEISFELRDKLYYASLTAGITISKTGTTYCHALSYFLNEEHGVPHGMACAAYLSGYILRAKEKVSEKASLFEKSTGIDLVSLSQLTADLTDKIDVTITKEEAEEIVDRYKGAKGLTSTLPDGLSKEEAIQIVSGLFVE